MAFSVIIHEKGGQPRRQDFDKNEITIGRVQGNDIVLPKQNVSKRHSRLVYKNQKFVITDLRSTNGTYVNGRKISAPNVIKENDKIYIGDFVLSTEASGAGGANAIPVSSTPPPPPPNFNTPFGGGMPAQTIASGVSPFVQKKEAPPAETGLSTPSVASNNAMIPPAPPTPTPPPPSLPTGRPSPPPSLPKTPSNMNANSASPFAQKPDAPPLAKPAERANAKVEKAQENLALKTSSVALPEPVPPTPSPTPEPVAAPVQVQAAHQGGHIVAVAPSTHMQSSVVSQTSSSMISEFQFEITHALKEKGFSLPTTFTLKQTIHSQVQEIIDSIKSNLESPVSTDDQEYAIDELFHLGTLTQLVQDSTVTSILMNGCSTLMYQHQAGSKQTQSNPFSSSAVAHQVARRVLSSIGGHDDDQSGSGFLADWRVVVDLEGNGGPYLSFTRALNDQSIESWVDEEHFDRDVLKAVEESISKGQGIIIASSHPKLQAHMSSAFIYQFFKDQTVASVGVPFHIGNEGSWINFEGTNEGLNRALRFAPQCLIVGDHPSLLVEDRVDAICASANGVLCLTMPTAQSAYEWLSLKLSDPQMITYGFRLILNVDVNAQGHAYLTSAFDLHQQQMIYTR